MNLDSDRQEHIHRQNKKKQFILLYLLVSSSVAAL
ncbi:hypothetical protein TcasGA2_TC034881 [Tribolium castaneum]|uniref:Uncharacterized protein n=1 Tax=Tribolium castaneum TaxID=7070 RepID=A0A139WBD8_TRICA|nr:hypothetical protein TcasGA2_TC034881 [Tribolium castaneum]